MRSHHDQPGGFPDFHMRSASKVIDRILLGKPINGKDRPNVID